jgi:hypothetical protein
MSDPYNSYPSNLPQPVADRVSVAPVTTMPRPKIDEIARLQVSDKWKARFLAIEKGGGPKLPKNGELSFSERRLVNSNWLAFFFWPVYLPMKGLWRQALTYFAIAIALVLVMELIGLGRFGRVVGYGIGAITAFRANIGYYKSTVLGEISWL